MFIPELVPVFNKYNNILKPLVAQYESQNESFVTSLLYDIPDLFEIMVSCSQARSQSEKDSFIEEANKSIDKAIVNCKKILCASKIQKIKKFEKRYSDEFLKSLDRGAFYLRYKKLSKEIRENKDNIEIMLDKAEELESLIISVQLHINSNKILVDSTSQKVLKFIISIFVSIVVSILTEKFL